MLSLHATGAVRGAANALCNIERTLDNLVTVYDQHMTAHGGSLTSEDQVPGLAAAVNLLLAAVGNKAFKEYAGFVKQALTRQAAKDPKGRLIAAAMAAPDVTAVRSVLLGCLNPKIDSLEMRKFRTRTPTDDRKEARSQMKGAAAEVCASRLQKCSGREEAGDPERLKPCPCRMVYYCSTACQRQHWKAAHKFTCSAVKKD